MRFALVPVAALAACATASRPPAAPACPERLDPAAVLARHAAGWGTPEAVRAALPATFVGTAELQGSTGRYERVLDRERHRDVLFVAGLATAAGLDERGAWTLDLPGVAARLRPEEALEVAFDAWLARRGYAAFDPARDEASCELLQGEPRALLRYRRPELGDPVLSFELGGALRSATVTTALGTPVRQEFLAWTDADGAGVRWPVDVETRDAHDNATRVRIAERRAGLACEPAGDCLAPPTPALRFTWPASGEVRVPMAFYLNEVSLRVDVGGREAWALLDSGAGITVLDATTPLGAAFRPALHVTGGAATQTVQLGLGEVEALALGALRAERLPVASVPIPMLDAYGARRPEVIVGFTYFLEAAVRVDYARGEIVLARDGARLHAPDAAALPMKLLAGGLYAEARIEGTTALFQLDTGAGGTFFVDEPWARAHGLAGDRKHAKIQGVFGAGDKPTEERVVRLREAALGPARLEAPLARVQRSPTETTSAGIVGNRVFARCAAVVFDVRGRTLWMEPPCDRELPEDKAGWRVKKSPSEARPDRPWVIETLVAGASADLAGVRAGDRLLEVGGRPAVLDIATWEEGAQAAPGTRTAVVVERDGRELRLEMVLRPVLGDEPP